jgi:hypothetical protein
MKKISNLLRNDKPKGIDKLSALFELELIEKSVEIQEKGESRKKSPGRSYWIPVMMPTSSCQDYING